MLKGLLKLIGYSFLTGSYLMLMFFSLFLGLVGGAVVSVVMSFKHYIVALHENL